MLGLLALLFSPLAVTGQVPAPPLQRLVQELLSQFPRVTGDIVDVRGPQVIVSVGAKDDLLPGTELIVVREGRELIHPRTREVLGHVETELGRLVIDEVLERYSVGRIVPKAGAGPVAVGDRVRISSGRLLIEILSLLAPTFDRETEQSVIDSLTRELERSGRFRVRLADLARHWMQEERVPLERLMRNPSIVSDKISGEHLFLLVPDPRDPSRFTAQLLSVRSSAVKVSASLPAALTSSRAEPPARAEPLPRSEPPVARREAPVQPPASAPSFFSATPSGFSRAAGQERRDQELAKFDRLFVSVDVTVPKSDAIPRVAATDGERVYIYRLDAGGPREDLRYAPSKRGQILSVQFAALGPGDASHVVVNQQIHDAGISSLVLLREEKSLKLLAEDSSNILLAMDRDGDGLKETLWGQRYDSQSFFSKEAVRRLSLQKDRLVEEERVEVPANFRATGAALADLGDKSGRFLVFIDAQRFLQVARGKEIVWSSPERVGGGHSTGEIVKTLSASTRQTERVNFEPNIVVADLDGDGLDEILVPRNVSPASSFLNVGNFTTGSGGEVLVAYREGVGFGLRPVTSKLPGLVSGIGLTAKSPLSLFVVVAKANFPPIPGGKSQFLLSESTQPSR